MKGIILASGSVKRSAHFGLLFLPLQQFATRNNTGITRICRQQRSSLVGRVRWRVFVQGACDRFDEAGKPARAIGEGTTEKELIMD